MCLLLLGVSPMTSMANHSIDLTDTRSDYNFIDAAFSFQVLKPSSLLPFGNGKKNDTEEEENEKNEENETEDEVEKTEKRRRLGFFYTFYTPANQVAYLLYFQTQTFARQTQKSYLLNQLSLSIYLLNHNFRN